VSPRLARKREPKPTIRLFLAGATFAKVPLPLTVLSFIEAAVRAELPWLLERSPDRRVAASEDTVSGRLRRAVTLMKQPYEQV